MPQRITNVSVTVFRDGKRQVLKPNTKFDFTKEEMDDITRIHKGALRKVDSDSDDLIDLTKADVAKPKSAGGNGGEHTNDSKPETANTGDKPLTAAQKKAQDAKAEKAKLADEQKAGDGEEGDL